MNLRSRCFRVYNIGIQRSPIAQRRRNNFALVAASFVLFTVYAVAVLNEPVNDIELPLQEPVTVERKLSSSVPVDFPASTAVPSLEKFLASHSFSIGNQTFDFSSSSWFNSSTNYTYDYEAAIKPQQSFSDLRYLFVVTTAVKYADRRKIVRETWRNHMQRNNDSKLVFLVGDPNDDDLQRHAMKEALEFDDLLQISFTEHYENMTLKSIMMLKWAEQWQPTFLVKVDDDVMINMELFRSSIETVYSRLPEFVAGFGIYGKIPTRDRNSKWFLTWSEYEQKLFPDYVAGMLYVIPGSLVPAFSSAAQSTRLAKFEDIFVTGFLAQKLNVTRIALPHMVIENPPSECTMRKILAIHTSPKLMKKLYRVLEGTEVSCK